MINAWMINACVLLVVLFFGFGLNFMFNARVNNDRYRFFDDPEFDFTS